MGKKTCDIILKEKPKQVSIEWNFYAHHYIKKELSWKQDPSLGGGALNFYCIHLIAWLASFSDWDVNYCSSLDDEDNDSKVKLNLSNKVTELTINFDSRNQENNFLRLLLIMTLIIHCLIWKIHFLKNLIVNQFIWIKEFPISLLY